MTTSTNISMNIADALKLTPEDIASDKFSIAELAELHNICSSSKQKKAKLQADIISAQIKKRKAEMPKEEKVLVENSVKLKNKKATPKANSKKADKPKAESKTEDKPKATPKAQPKKEEPKELADMSKEELMKYIAQMQDKQSKELFPETIEGEKIRFVQSEFKTIKEIQTHLMEKPFTLYLYMDEKIDDKLTQFQVLFATSEVYVLLDKTRQTNTTITFHPKQISDGAYKDKNGTFPVRFYVREVKEQETE